MRTLLGLIGFLVLLGCQPTEATRPAPSTALPKSPEGQGGGRRVPPAASAIGTAAAFSPDGKWLLTELTKDNHGPDVPLPAAWKRVTLWEVATGKVVKTFPADYRGENPYLLAFLPDGKRAISAGWGYWRLFEVPGGKVIRDVKVENKHFFPLDLSRDGKRLLSCGAGGRGKGLSLWDVESGEVVRNFFTAYPIIGGRLSPDGNKALIGSIPAGLELDTLHVWDFEGGREILKPKGGAAFTPDSKGFVAIEGGWLILWDTKAGKVVRKIDDVWSERWLDVVFTPDGKSLLAVADRHIKRIDLNGDKVVWSAELVKAAPLYAQHVPNTVAFSPDRTVAFVACGEQRDPNDRMDFALWDTARGKLLRKLYASE
jgi:WD40 repeat protein